MKKVPVSEIEDEMLLARPLVGPDGKILLGVNTVLKKTMAARLQNWGITTVYIEQEGDEGDDEKTGDKEQKLKTLEKTFEGVLIYPNMRKLYDAVKLHIKEKH